MLLEGKLVSGYLVGLTVGSHEDVLVAQMVEQHIGCATAFVQFLGLVALLLVIAESQQVAVALIAGLLTIGILALYLVYFIKLAGLMNTIQETSVSGFCRGRVPGFLSGMNIITAVLILIALIGVLALRQEFLEALYGDASAVYFGRMLTSQYSLMIFQLVLALVLLISFTVALSVLKRRLLEAQTFYIR